MKLATHELDEEQKTFLAKLHLSVAEINEADDLLTKNRGNETASRQATALLLSAIAKVYVMEVAEKYNMATRLPGFTKKF